MTCQGKVSINDTSGAEAGADMGAEVRAAMAGDPPSLPCKYFYDDRGSRLFQEITRLPEYYQKRNAESVLERVADEEVAAFGAADLVEEGGGFLVCIGLVKDKRVAEAAYDDAAGVTARFNRNILQVMNDRLGADFDPSAFDHVAFYDEQNAWIEMRLRARRAQGVRIPGAGVDLRLAPGDEIRTEISCKYSRASLEAKLPGTGLRLGQWHAD